MNSKPALGLVEFVTLMACMTSLAALSIDAMLPALSTIGQELKVDVNATHLIVSLFFIGMAFGQLYYGPVCDVKGRKYVIVSGIILFSIGTIVCIYAESLEVLLAGRIVQAFGVSGPRVASLAVIRDQYEGDAMARVMSFIMMVFILVPMIAPVVGQVVLAFGDWRDIFGLFLVIAAIVGAWFIIRQPETLPKDKRKPFSWRILWRSSYYVLTHKYVMACVLSMGLIFGAFLAYISGSQTIFQDFYLVGEQFPMYFAILAFSLGCASFINGRLVMKYGMKRLSRLAFRGLLTGSIVLTGIAWFYQGLPPLWLLMCIFFEMYFCVGILFGNLNAMAMAPLGQVAGLGAAIIGFFSSLLSVPIAVFIGSFMQQTVLPIGVGFVVCTILCILLMRWGNEEAK